MMYQDAASPFSICCFLPFWLFPHVDPGSSILHYHSNTNLADEEILCTGALKKMSRIELITVTLARGIFCLDLGPDYHILPCIMHTFLPKFLRGK